MPQIDTYTAGTVSLTNGSTTVNGAGTNWMSSSGTYSVLKGHIFWSGNFFSPIAAVSSAGQLTLAIPYTGSTASGLPYNIFRYTWVETAAVAGFLQALMDRGSKTKPATRWDIDSGAMTMTLRQDDAGSPAVYVGATGAPDGAMIKSLTFDKATANLWTGASIGVGTGGGAINYRLDVRGPMAATALWMQDAAGGAYPDSWIGGFTGLDGDSAHKFLHIGGATSVDGHRRISFQASETSTTGRLRVGAETYPLAAIHVSPTLGAPPVRIETGSDNAPMMVLYKNTGAVDQKFWDFQPSTDGAILSLRAVNDSYTAATNLIDISRSGITGTGIYFRCGLQPGQDAGWNLGGASFRWGALFAASGTINTSDATLKDVRGEPTDAELDAWGSVRAKIYRFLDAIAAKGEGARLHSGWIAQEVAAAFEAEGLDPRHYALFCADTVIEKVTTMVPGKVPVFDEREETSLSIEVIDGVPRQVSKTSTVREQRFEQVPVIGLDGQPLTEWRPDPEGDVVRDLVKGRMVPVTHPVPVMEDGEVEQVTESEPYERLGLRYDECLVMEAAWGRRELARVHEKIAALTARVAALEPAAA